MINDENFTKNQSDAKVSKESKNTIDENENKISDNSVEPDNKKTGEVISFDQFKKKR
jgi:hypothetical protein